VQSNNVTCFDSLNGSIHSVVSGGTGSYTYVWSNGAGTASISGLGANAYNVIVTDSNSCSASATATISQPAPLALVPQTDSTNCGLNNGNAGVTVTGVFIHTRLYGRQMFPILHRLWRLCGQLFSNSN